MNRNKEEVSKKEERREKCHLERNEGEYNSGRERKEEETRMLSFEEEKREGSRDRREVKDSETKKQAKENVLKQGREIPMEEERYTK